jgi:hypothetical protein
LRELKIGLDVFDSVEVSGVPETHVDSHELKIDLDVFDSVEVSGVPGKAQAS